MHSLTPWVVFHVFIIAMLALDLGVFNRKAHEIKFKEAATWSVIWIALAIAFNVGVWMHYGRASGLEFFTGYVIEKSLSIDNIFVFLLLFRSFKVPAKYQHRVLFWGVLGALAMRGIFIAVGISLIQQFHAVIYIFGGFLIFTALKMLLTDKKEVEFEKNIVLRIAKKIFPVAPHYDEGKFITEHKGRTMVTPLFLVLIALAAILGFVGFKMVFSGWFKIPIAWSLTAILSMLTIAIIASWIRARNES
ncbi:TerC/Alx family metal homeostasis membrane protein [bacterium]|nr:TerC/Alx family metal homeostasis membrane protein [bacterium]